MIGGPVFPVQFQALGGAVGAALAFGGAVAGLFALVTAWRGVIVDPTRPPSRAVEFWSRWTRPRVVIRFAGAVLIATAVFVITRWPVAAVATGVLVAAWTSLFGGARAEQAAVDRLEALVTWTESLRDTVAAHASLEHAIPAATQHAPEEIRPALVALSGQIRARIPLDRALYTFAAALDDPSADRVVAALVLNVRRRGDRLEQVLSGLVTTSREELDLRRRIMAGREGLRRGVQIVIGLTVVMAGYLMGFGGGYLRPYDSAGGQVALAVVIALFTVGIAWMRRLAVAQAPPSFLARPGVHLPAADVRVVASLTGLAEADADDASRVAWGRWAR